MIPESPVETESNAERRLFERLRDETPDDIVAFHSVAWQLPGKKRPPRAGRGRLRPRPPRLRRAHARGEGRHRPLRRARPGSGSRPARRASRRSRIPGARRGARRTRSAARSRAPRAEATRRSASGTPSPSPTAAFRRRRCDRISRASSSSTTRTSRAFPSGSTGSSATGSTRTRRRRSARDGIDRLERVLANSFELRAPLAFELAEEERRLYRLTEQQYQVLDMLSRQTRVAIAGCAGSGKTFLAAEKARRLAAAGLPRARRRLQRPPRRAPAARPCRRAEHHRSRLLRALPRGRGGGRHRVRRRARARRGRRVLHRRSPPPSPSTRSVMAGRFDALIVDEGQDVVRRLVAPAADPPRRPRPRARSTSSSTTTRSSSPSRPACPFLEEPFQLTVNCRNTRRINELVMRFYKGGTIEAPGPGRPARRPARVRDGGGAPRAARRGGRALDRRGGGRARRHRATDRARSATGARSGRWTRSAASA